MRRTALTLTTLTLTLATLTACGATTDPCRDLPITPAERAVIHQGPTYTIEREHDGTDCELSTQTGARWQSENDATHTTSSHKPTRRPTPRTTR